MKIIKATVENVADIAPLFDLYRQFYECAPDIALATRLISDRLERQEADIFLALDGNSACGFVQLYPSFCSVDAVKIYILHDLYVDERYRKSGVGRKLMDRATSWAKETGAGRLDLLTDHSNQIGQHLYESLGYEKVLEDYFAYSLKV